MMRNNYDEGVYSLEFSNEELDQFLIEPFKDIDGVSLILKSTDDDILSLPTTEEIGFIVYDGEDEETFISFNHCQVSIYFLGQEIMFIDESVKNNYSSSDTEYNIVFEGKLRKMNHDEILNMFRDIIKLILKASDVSIKTTPLEGDYSYGMFEYDIKLTGVLESDGGSSFNNIKFI